MSLFRKILTPIIIASTALLTACATPDTFTTQVNAFNNWPADTKGKLYAFSNDVSQNLEQKSYADLIAKEMWRTGLMQTNNIKKAHYLVNFNASTETREKIVQEYYEEPMFVPTFGFGFGNFGYGYPGWGWGNNFYSGVGISYTPRVAQYPIQISRHTLALEIKNNKTGNPVYQAKAVADSQNASLTQVMPYLAVSVFDNFPGSNGGTRHIEFDIDKSREQQTPVKYIPE
ncbi:DUF4136 domain-containing protein [Pelistega suis]|uniref:DUF4136 domain-containing protein n=1 Tax=Pelistega suis TaxID=1631957 RepID=UPI00211BEDE8|nr:DUF4136 domain-containing protein [Pelistega suis]MCQ9328538.1 DUF4136 domain-containing protein [Pelistega suis]